MSDEPNQSTDLTEEQKKGDLGGTVKGSQSYGTTSAPEEPKTAIDPSSKGNKGSYSAG